MLLNAEIKDDHYGDLPRQQLQAQYAYPAPTYLKADAVTGRNYVDLNAAAASYQGAWLFGTQNVNVLVGGLKAEWVQWCPVPAGIGDGILLRGNVVYENPDRSFRRSDDVYEGVIRTEGATRVFEGQTQHTFTGKNVPGGYLKVSAPLRIPLLQRFAYNPMKVSPSTQLSYTPPPAPHVASYGNAYSNYSNQSSAPTYTSSSADEEPDSGF